MQQLQRVNIHTGDYDNFKRNYWFRLAVNAPTIIHWLIKGIRNGLRKVISAGCFTIKRVVRRCIFQTRKGRCFHFFLFWCRTAAAERIELHKGDRCAISVALLVRVPLMLSATSVTPQRAITDRVTVVGTRRRGSQTSKPFSWLKKSHLYTFRCFTCHLICGNGNFKLRNNFTDDANPWVLMNVKLNNFNLTQKHWQCSHEPSLLINLVSSTSRAQVLEIGWKWFLKNELKNH